MGLVFSSSSSLVEVDGTTQSPENHHSSHRHQYLPHWQSQELEKRVESSEANGADQRGAQTRRRSCEGMKNSCEKGQEIRTESEEEKKQVKFQGKVWDIAAEEWRY